MPDDIAHYLVGRHLVILADNDSVGRDHAEKKAALAYKAGAASIRIIHFPELSSKADVSDFIASGGTAEQLLQRIDAAPIRSPPIESVHGDQSAQSILSARYRR